MRIRSDKESEGPIGCLSIFRRRRASDGDEADVAPLSRLNQHGSSPR